MALSSNSAMAPKGHLCDVELEFRNLGCILLCFTLEYGAEEDGISPFITTVPVARLRILVYRFVPPNMTSPMPASISS